MNFKNSLFFIVLLVGYFQTHAQSKMIYLNEKLEKINTKKQALYYRNFVINDDLSVSFSDYFIADNTLRISGFFTDTTQTIFNGNFIFYNHGIKNTEGLITNNAFEGMWKYYSEKEILKEKKMFVNGEETGFRIIYSNNGFKTLEGNFKNNKRDGFCIEYHLNWPIKALEGNYENGIGNGWFKYYYIDGKLEKEGILKNDIMTDMWKMYDVMGNIVCAINFNDSLKNKASDTCFNNKTYHFVERMPSYIGGEEALEEFFSKNLKYPETYKETDSKQKVSVQFVINSKGYIQNVVATEFANEEFANAAIAVIKKMPKWSPGIQNGKTVDVIDLFHNSQMSID